MNSKREKPVKDWEIHYARLWAHPSNARFARPTKRVLDTPPPIQAFPPRIPAESVGDVAVAIGLVAALVTALALW